jgi:hypothetical protein|nr:phage tail protein [Kofleriaceae bacterium]
MALRRSYSAGHFELAIDGQPSTAYLRSVEGGFAHAAVVDEAIGSQWAHVKHAATVDIEPLSIELGLAGAGDILDWIAASWRREPARRSGQVTHATFDLQPTLVHELYDALVVETTFPALDGASKEAAYLKVKLQPERVSVRPVVAGPPLLPGAATDQKRWVPSAFRLVLDGIAGLEHASKLDAFTIKQGTKKLYVGGERFPQVEPTKLEFPNLSGQIALAHADDLLAWHDRAVVGGDVAETSGALELLTPDRREVLLRIALYEVGLFDLQVAQAQANADAIKRVKFQLYVGRMELERGL